MAGKNSGGWFRGKPWQDPQKQNGELNCFMVAWGEVITPKNSMEAVRVTSFQNRYGTTGYKVEVVIAMIGKNYEKLISWGDNKVSNTMSRLQNGDRVVAFGKERTYHYQTKNGEEKEAREMSVFLLFADGHAEATEELISNPGILRFMEQSAAADAALPEDATESNPYDAEYDAESAYDPMEDATESGDDAMDNPDLPQDKEEYYADPDEYMENPDLPEPPFA